MTLGIFKSMFCFIIQKGKRDFHFDSIQLLVPIFLFSRKYHCLGTCFALLAKVDHVLSSIYAKLSVKPVNLDPKIKVRSCDYGISILDQC